MKATWQFEEDEGTPTLRVELGNDQRISLSFYTNGGPLEPLITLYNPSRGYPRLLGDDQADVFRKWLIAAAAKPRVKAG